MAFFTPWDVFSPYRKFALFVFFVLIAGYAVLAVLSTIDTFEHYQNPMVSTSVRNTSPLLPYMYVCPSSRHYSFSTVAAGCGEDVLRKLGPTSRLDRHPFLTSGTCMNRSLVQLAAGNSSFATDGNCSVGIASIKVEDRLLRRPLEMTCVTFFFRYPVALNRIDWLGEFYVLYNLTLNLTSNPPVNKTGLISQSLVAYFSDTGNSTLETEDCFIRDKRVRELENSPERFEQGGVTLPENKRSDFSLVKRVRRFIAGVRSVQYMVDSSGVVSYEVSDSGLVGSLAAEHGIQTVVANGLKGVLMQVGINFDEIEEREIDIRTGLFNLLGTLGGQVTWFTAALALIFIEARDGPYMTITYPWRMLLTLFRKTMQKEDGTCHTPFRSNHSGGEEGPSLRQ
eukprot:TRINITY_DN2210_c0_g5_i1.p1 TRINITY_DN2210_c0_g5~~TRINITY_DN2210_c0_g5_i1.p1  ORF type:complete len:396 (+),score=34.78 TRINITY_DN2210_c0_g5_i1:2520-3707(+)